MSTTGQTVSRLLIPNQAVFIGHEVWDGNPNPGEWTWCTKHFRMIGVIGRSPANETIVWLKAEGFGLHGDEERLTIRDSFFHKRPWTIENGIWKPTGYPDAPHLPAGWKHDPL